MFFVKTKRLYKVNELAFRRFLILDDHLFNEFLKGIHSDDFSFVKYFDSFGEFQNSKQYHHEFDIIY